MAPKPDSSGNSVATSMDDSDHAKAQENGTAIELQPTPAPATATQTAATAPTPPGSGPPALSPGGFNGELYKPRTLKFWSTILSNFLALFLVALDRTIIATAIPRITDDFNSLGDIGWYGSAYMLTTAAFQLLFGRIYKFYDMKWVFLISIIVFEIGSAICGAAPTSNAFIVGRAIAGAGSAGIFSGVMLILIPMIPLHKRPQFQGMFGMVFGIASVLGPVVGGGFTGGVSWRWCFYINLPVGAVTFLFMIFFWNPPPRQLSKATPIEHFKRLDPLGSFFLIPSIVCLLLALQWGGVTYAWNDGRIIALFVLFAVLGAAFVTVQILMPETATVPARVIKQRSIFFATTFTFFIAGSMLIMVYFLPIWFQTVKGVSPLTSGVYTLPLVLSLVVASMLGGKITQSIGYYVPAMFVCPCIMAVGEGLMSTFNQNTGSNLWIAYQFLGGFGLGLGMQTGGLAVQAILPFSDIPTGTALIFFSQQIGGAVFTSVGQAMLSNLLADRLAGVPGIDVSQIAQQGATTLANRVSPEDIGLVVGAYNYALTRIFLTAMGLAFGALISAFGMEWKDIRKKKVPGGPPGATAGGASEAGSAGSTKGADVERTAGAH